jgi:TonB-dependent receptor
MNVTIYGKRGLARLAAIVLAVLVSGPVMAQTQLRGKPVTFSLSSGPAVETVPSFARQSGMQVLANTSDLEGVTTSALYGAVPAREGLQKLLEGTPLTARIKANGTAYIVRTPQVSPVPEPPAPMVVVVGFRRSYADVIRMKRAAIGITDSISSDGMGRFPDLNAGEAVQRITGVQINREVESRNATINLRGLPGTYTRTTINGQAFAEPILDSSTPLGAFSSDIFSAITINKSPSAADQPGGLSGNIDLIIQPALGRPDGGVFKVAYEHNDLGHMQSPAATLGYNTHFGPDLAVFGIVAFKTEKFRRDSVNFNQYTPLNALTPGFSALYADYYAPFSSDGSCPSGQACDAPGTGLKSKTGVLFPSDNRQLIKYNAGTLTTSAAGLEYKPSDGLKLGLNGFFTRRNLDETHTDMLEVDLRPAMTRVTPTAGVFTLTDGYAYVNQLDYANPQVNLSTRYEPAVQEAWSLNGDVEWRTGDWRASGRVVASQARNTIEQTQIDWRTVAQPGAGNGLSGHFFSGGGDIGRYTLSLKPASQIVVSPGPWAWVGLSNPAFQQNAQGDQLIVAGTSGYAHNQLFSGQGDIERFVHAGIFNSVAAGLRIERDRFESRGFRTSAKGVRTDAIDAGFLRDSTGAGNFFGGEAAGYLSTWRIIDYDYAIAHLRPLKVEAGDTLTATGWINDAGNGNYSANNFTVSNDIASAYVTGKIETSLGGLALRSHIGLRFETTDQTIDALNKKTDLSGTITYLPETFRQSYQNILPSVLVAADLSSSLVLRAAAYKTFVRPQPRILSPATSVTNSLNGFNVAYGGYALKPYTALSYDLSLEWYNRPGSLLSFALFQKTIQDLVGPETRLERLCPADATAFGLGHLSVRGSQCVSDIIVNGQPAVITATGNFNQDRPITVNGLEMSAQQTFDFLPGFWKNFGGVINYSLTRITGHNADGSKAVLPGVSKNACNLIGYYEGPRFGVRIVYNYRDEYILPGGTTFTGGASRVEARGQMDASASYAISERFSVSLDAFNLTDARRTQYQNIASVPRANDYDGRTYTLTLRRSF